MSDYSIEKKGAAWEKSRDEFDPIIPGEEFEVRIAKARELLVKHEIDAMLLFSYDNKYYYGGYRESNYRYTNRWRHSVLISTEHDPVFIGESVLAGSVQRTTWIRDIRCWSQIKIWRLPLTFIDVLKSTLKDLGLHQKRIGLEYGDEFIHEVSIREIKEIEAAFPDAAFVPAGPVIWEQRMIKTSWEIELIRELCKKSGKALEKGWRSIKPGVRERDIHKAIWQEYINQEMFDAPCMTNITLSMSGSETPGQYRLVTTPFWDRVIKPGDQGFADSGPTYKGYWSDFQRGFYVGASLPPVLKELSSRGRDAYLNTVSHIIPGMRGCDIFKIAEKEVYRQDMNQIMPIDFVGHGIGLLNHEQPWLSPESLTELQPGMVICVEVGCFDNTQVFLGNMPEDMYLVTDTGLERLGIDFPRDVFLCQ
jgi:Xaa-Pro dipeptidase